LEFPNVPDPIKDHAGVIKKNAERLLGMVNRILDIRRLEMNENVLSPTKFDLIAYSRKLIQIYEGGDKTISFHTNVEILNVFMDLEGYDKILSNLLSNAFKYTPKNGDIIVTINYQTNHQKILLEVKDDGPGIPEEEKTTIFNRFYRLKNEPSTDNKGFGIGLHLVKEIVDAMKGSVSVHANKPSGSVFSVYLPITLTTDSSMGNEPSTDILTLETPSLIDHQIEELEDRKELERSILIVEDNDDLRHYIASVFASDKFDVLKAIHGKEGLTKAIEHIPDIIITDVMMPEMDGKEMVKVLKNDDRTNHIPIIMLTAKTLPEDHKEGLNTGADDYLTKPFDEQILKAKIDSLLKNRKILQDKFKAQLTGVSMEENTGPGSLPEEGLNQIFVDKVKASIAKHYTSESFNTEKLAEDLNISRRHLHRKFSGLTGMSSSEYLRDFRLQKASELLKTNTELTVNEVAFQTGFKNASHFSRLYKEKYGKNPSLR
jgi:DNA-binding response OmpR family regulator/two-component sensor histidine kinase